MHLARFPRERFAHLPTPLERLPRLGAALGGLIGVAKAGRFRGETVVFLHTGGAQGLFGYQGEMQGALA